MVRCICFICLVVMFISCWVGWVKVILVCCVVLMKVCLSLVFGMYLVVFMMIGGIIMSRCGWCLMVWFGGCVLCCVGWM